MPYLLWKDPIEIEQIWQFFESAKVVTMGYKNGLVALWNKESSIHQR